MDLPATPDPCWERDSDGICHCWPRADHPRRGTPGGTNGAGQTVPAAA